MCANFQFKQLRVLPAVQAGLSEVSLLLHLYIVTVV